MREKLPDRRSLWMQKVKIEGQTFHLGVGEYDDGRVGELWLDVNKQGSMLRGFAAALVRLASIALQNGTPVEEIVTTMSGLNFPPNGPVVGETTTVTHCSSVPDWIAQELTIAYLQDQLPTEPIPTKSAGHTPEAWRSGV